MQAENYTSPKIRAEISTFLDRFEKYRARAALTEEVAADAIGYSRSWIQKMKSGAVSPNKKAWSGLERAERGIESVPPPQQDWQRRAEEAEAKLAALKMEISALLKKL